MTKTAFYADLAAFRGLAILTIVAAHAWSFTIFWTGGLNAEGLPTLFWFTEVLFHGSTLYFAILSGLLFSLVLHQKSWGEFYLSKGLNVFLPYVFVTLIATAFYWQYQTDTDAAFIPVVLDNLVSGTGMLHFWYLLVLFFLFAITPALAWCRQHKSGQWALAVVALLPLVVSRSPYPDFLQPQSFVYFTGAYALGILWGQHYEWVLKKLSQYKMLLMGVVTVASLLLWYTYEANMQHDGLFSVRQSLVYIQKLAIMAVIVVWLSKRESQQSKWMLIIGEYAFAIYFLHVFFIGTVIMTFNDWITANRDPISIAIVGGVNQLAGVIGALVCAYTIKRLFGRHARKLIGA